MKLTLVGLPLGNIEDISRRAVSTIALSKHLICEDTRVFLRLWAKLRNLNLVASDFGGKLYVLNDFNERRQAIALISQLQGESVTLVADAGMSVVSDPGFRLVNEAVAAGWQIDAVPGPTAAMTALAVSGLPPDLVTFVGFLPQKGGKLKQRLETLKQMASLGATIIIYESPYRLKQTLFRLEQVIGPAKAAICRELTKSHQQILRGSLKELLAQLETAKVKGEVGMVLSSRTK